MWFSRNLIEPLFYRRSASDTATAMMTGAAAVVTVAPLPGVSTWYFWLLEGASFVSSMVTVPVPCSGAMPNDLRFQRGNLRTLDFLLHYL